MRVIGIIPARGGSKGVPRKNIRLVAGAPLITYAIRTARESQKLTALLTTKDDDEIAEIARGCGSPVLERPSELARDDTPMAPVLLHALEHAEWEAGVPYDAVVLLQPTSPIRTGADIDSVVGILEHDPTVESVISVSPVHDGHPAYLYHLYGGDWVEPLWPDWERARRQELPIVYGRNGALFGVRRGVLVEQRTVMARHPKAYVMPREWLTDIDDERDLAIADVLVRLWKDGHL